MKTIRFVLPFVVAGMLLTTAVQADTFGTAVGGGLGAVAGAVIGDSMGGRNGAIVGSGIGGAMGAVVGQSVSQPSYGNGHYGGYGYQPRYQSREVHHYYHEDRRHHGHGHGRGHYKHHGHGHSGHYR
ncbi:MAG: hypothetical protein QG616_625 [Pseudomonadota bacterium]|nr:hypothetical protein [Pseudomonadota bacterium]MDQ5880795.1 hypothetical protein [Pseudomonadota bacterium]MDQ5903890.1 hypothetical protein [Pseudomonadota bacterium]MDQ5905950.1 hypothetical protein [Pseudomonadota bacterium]MDQ5915069.1 hypothetical protein [Pseudomonadota bacterium]